jgi:predicted RNA-binding Zn ribbon-like protein
VSIIGVIRLEVSVYLEDNAYYSEIAVRSQMMMNAYDVRLAVMVEDLINTYDLFLDEPEHLQTPADLDGFLKQHGQPVEVRPTQDDLDAVRSLREALRAIWNAPETSASRDQLNRLLGTAPVMLHLDHDENAEGVALHADPDRSASIVEQLAVTCAVSIVGVMQHYGADRMRACESSPCQDVFIDTSRNKSRRFCSERCANRYNVAAFRERKK